MSANPDAAPRSEPAAAASKESWIRDHLKLGPIAPVGRVQLYALVAIVTLSVVWVLFGSTLVGLLLLLRSGPGF